MKIQPFIFNWKNQFDKTCEIENSLNKVFEKITVINSDDDNKKSHWINIGEEYPMFYENIKDTPDKYLLNESFITKTHHYLIERSKLDIFTIDKFKNDIISFIQ